MLKTRHLFSGSDRGISLVEMLIVVGIMVIISAAALPTLLSSRILFRSAGIAHEIVTQLRLARQQAMAQQQAVTFQYNDLDKQIVIIYHQIDGVKASGLAVLTDVNYPNNGVSSPPFSLTGYGITAEDFVYDRPPGAPLAPLADGTTMTPLTNNLVNITFQPDGSVQRATGNPATLVPDDCTLFFYNAQAPSATARAISVLGASGRVKLWRYTDANSYAE